MGKTRRSKKQVSPPDWLVYAFAVGVILASATLNNQSITTLKPPPLGDALLDVQPSDPRILVDIGPRGSGAGTAFSIDDTGTWLTARHVVDGCDRVGLIAGTSRAVSVDAFEISQTSDSATLKTRWIRPALPTDMKSPRRLGEIGYFFGFPQGRPGEVSGTLLGRHNLITRGRYNTDEAVLAWAELGRTRGLKGSLGGLSGAPAFDSDGEVIGIVAAQSPRRGRIYTVAPKSVAPLIPSAANPPRARAISLNISGQEADRYRRDRRITQVICLVD